MGTISAILELLVSCRGEVIHVADRLPKGWRELSFSRVRLEGGFVLDGRFRHGRAEALTVHSLHGGPLLLSHSLGSAWALDGDQRSEPVLSLATRAGQDYHLRRVVG